MILPPPSESFDWVQTDAGPALVCRPLREAAAHLFTTRHWRLASQVSGTAESTESEGWADLARVIGVPPENLVRVRQVHGATVVVGHPATLQRPEADVLVAGDPHLSLALQTADCVPLLLADRRTGAVAAAHAGWRGLASQAPAAAIRALGDHFRSRPIDLLAAVGPSIGACCYEVGADVRERFVNSTSGGGVLAAWFLDAPRRSAHNPSLKNLQGRSAGGRWFFDMWAATCAQLSAAGVRRDQVFVAESARPATLTRSVRFGVTGRPQGVWRPRFEECRASALDRRPAPFCLRFGAVHRSVRQSVGASVLSRRTCSYLTSPFWRRAAGREHAAAAGPHV